MLKTWRRTGLVALAAGAALAVQLTAVAPAQATAGPTITIAATSKLKVVTNDVFVVYKAGTYAVAMIHGTITGAASGDVESLFAQQFPFKKAPVKVGSQTIKSAKWRYSYTVTPSLYTKYALRVFAGGKEVGTSRVQNVYVSSLGAFTGSSSCPRPKCHATLNVFVTVPSSALGFEMAKHVYPYFGLNLNATKKPPFPTVLKLNAGSPSVKTHKVNAGEYEITINYTFTIGNDAASWLPAECQRDAVYKDGIGLPGSHGCGASQLSTSQYYVG